MGLLCKIQKAQESITHRENPQFVSCDDGKLGTGLGHEQGGNNTKGHKNNAIAVEPGQPSASSVLHGGWIFPCKKGKNLAIKVFSASNDLYYTLLYLLCTVPIFFGRKHIETCNMEMVPK